MASRASLTKGGSTKRGGRRELDALAHALGLEGTGFTRLDAKLDGARVLVQLEYLERREILEGELFERQVRVAQALVLTVKFEGSERSKRVSDPPSIQLRRETEADRGHKRTGLVTEVQTGFAGFDHAVFIDNDSSRADAERILSKEATRQAVLRLLEAGHAAVDISTTGVSVRRVLDRDERDFVHVQPVLDALDDLRIVARAGGPKDARPKRRGESSAPVLVALGVLALLYGFVFMSKYSSGVLPLLISVVVAGITVFFARPFIEEDLSGDAGSGRRAGQVLLSTFCLVVGLGAGGLAQVNAVFDSSELRVVNRVVTEVWMEGKGTRRHQYLSVRGPDGSETVQWDGPARPGDRYVEWRGDGALGFEWVASSDVKRSVR